MAPSLMVAGHGIILRDVADCQRNPPVTGRAEGVSKAGCDIFFDVNLNKVPTYLFFLF